jgi:NAD(P)-dependent dehydrogenase (short-subunit alcohol dehydrogenase family)
MAKTAIIVGASRGLGLGLAREFARRGWQVTATARSAAAATQLADAAARIHRRGSGPRAESVDALAGRRYGHLRCSSSIERATAVPIVSSNTSQLAGAVIHFQLRTCSLRM